MVTPCSDVEWFGFLTVIHLPNVTAVRKPNVTAVRLPNDRSFSNRTAVTFEIRLLKRSVIGRRSV